MGQRSLRTIQEHLRWRRSARADPRAVESRPAPALSGDLRADLYQPGAQSLGCALDLARAAPRATWIHPGTARFPRQHRIWPRLPREVPLRLGERRSRRLCGCGELHEVPPLRRCRAHRDLRQQLRGPRHRLCALQEAGAVCRRRSGRACHGPALLWQRRRRGGPHAAIAPGGVQQGPCSALCKKSSRSLDDHPWHGRRRGALPDLGAAGGGVDQAGEGFRSGPRPGRHPPLGDAPGRRRVSVRQGDWPFRPLPWAGAPDARSDGGCAGIALAAIATLAAAPVACPPTLQALAERAWDLRARTMPFSSDDIPRLERPPGLVRSWSRKSVEQQRAEWAALRACLRRLPEAGLPVPQRVDRRLIGSLFARVEWGLDVHRRWARDPTFYLEQTLTPVLELLVQPPPIDEARARELLSRLHNISPPIPDGKENLRGGVRRLAPLA